MKITHEISVDFKHRGLRPRIEIKENDLATRYVHVSFYCGGEPYAVTVATTDALMCYAKPDGTSGVYDTIGEGADQHDAAVFDIDGKGVTIELAPSMAKGFGLLHCEVRLVSDGQILGTFTFDIDVERSVTTGTRADDYFSYRALDQLYDYVDDAVGKIDSLASGDVVKLPYEIGAASGSIIKWQDGSQSTQSTLTRYGRTGYIDISGHDQIHYSRIRIHATSFAGGMAFYKSDKTAIAGTTDNRALIDGESDVWEYVDATIAVPADAVYARFTFLSADVDGFYCGYKPAIAERIDQLSEHIDTEVAAISGRIDTEFGEFLNIKNVDLSADTTYPVKITNHKNQNAIIHISGSWSGAEAPSIRANRNRWNPAGSTRLAYFGTPRYTIGYEPNRVVSVDFRIPAQEPSVQLLNIIVSVPDGTSLHINELSIRYDGTICRDEMPIAFWAHGMNGGAYPVNTLAAFDGAARLGYRYCITIPKVTADDVLVCLHDDESIGATARHDDGSKLTAAENKPVSQILYSTLQTYDFGISRGRDYKGQRIPTLEQFFSLCAKTGMHPALSVHPDLSGHWARIRTLAEKYNVLRTLNIKAPSTDTIGVCAAVLGNDIESYTLNSSADADMVETMDNACADYDIDRTKVRVCIEYKYSVLTDAKISNALSNDYAVGVYSHFEDTLDSMGGYYASVVDNLIAKGVTQFSEDRIANNGLAW